jgi:hypothetical protein
MSTATNLRAGKDSVSSPSFWLLVKVVTDGYFPFSGLGNLINY